MSALIIFGDKTANEMLAVAQERLAGQYESIETYFFDPKQDHDSAFKRLNERYGPVKFLVGVIDARLRNTIRRQALDAGFTAESVIHPTAVVAATATIGDGSFLGPLCVVSEDAEIGEHSIIHIHASVGHNCRIGQDCVILPGARLSGDVVIGDRVLIGSNAFVYQGVKLGDDVQVDALTYVRTSIESGMLVSCRAKSPVKRVRDGRINS